MVLFLTGGREQNLIIEETGKTKKDTSRDST
jgi:hypothetical protein